MQEGTAPSELGVRLAQAREWIERGDQGRALSKLREAEALACGNEDAIRELREFASAFQWRVEPKHAPELARLVDAISPPAPPSDASSSEFRGALLAFTVLLSAVAGFVAFGFWGFAAGCGLFSGDPVGGYGAHIIGPAGIAALLGIALWLVSLAVAARHLDRLLYLLIPLPGFVLVYIAILMLIAEVGKAIWGPTQCP